MNLGEKNASRGHAWFYAVFVVLLAAHAAMVWMPRVYPMVDIPFRLASSEIIRHISEPGSRFSNYYVVDLSLKPNILYSLFCSRSIFPSAEFANRVFLILYTLSVPILVLMIIRNVGGNIWFSLLSFLMVYNMNFSWGFMDYLMAIPIILFAFYLMMNYMSSGHTWQAVVISLLLVAAFFAHVLAMLFGVALFSACCTYRGWKKRTDVAKDFAVIMPALGVLAVWSTGAMQYGRESFGVFLLKYYKSSYWMSVPNRLTRISAIDNRHLFAGLQGLVMGVVLTLPIIVAAVAWLRLNLREFIAGNSKSHAHYVVVFAIVATAMWAFFPEEVPGNILLYERFAVFTMLALVVLGSLVRWRRRSAVVLPAIFTAVFLHFALHVDYFNEFNRINRAFTAKSLPEAGDHSIMSGMIYAPKFRGIPVYIHWPCYYITWKHGIACTSLTDFRFCAIKRRVNNAGLPVYEEWLYLTRNYAGRYSNLDYILVRGRIEQKHNKYLRNFTPTPLGAGWRIYARQAMEH